jgi:hypothetical protein
VNVTSPQNYKLKIYDMKKILTKFQFGESYGEKIDLTVGVLRIKKTADPEETLGFNDFWIRIHTENALIAIKE